MANTKFQTCTSTIFHVRNVRKSKMCRYILSFLLFSSALAPSVANTGSHVYSCTDAAIRVSQYSSKIQNLEERISDLEVQLSAQKAKKKSDREFWLIMLVLFSYLIFGLMIWTSKPAGRKLTHWIATLSLFLHEASPDSNLRITSTKGVFCRSWIAYCDFSSSRFAAVNGSSNSASQASM